MDAVQALDDDALQLVESSIIPNLKAWGCVQLRFVCVCTSFRPASSARPSGSSMKNDGCRQQPAPIAASTSAAAPAIFKRINRDMYNERVPIKRDHVQHRFILYCCCCSCSCATTLAAKVPTSASLLTSACARCSCSTMDCGSRCRAACMYLLRA